MTVISPLEVRPVVQPANASPSSPSIQSYWSTMYKSTSAKAMLVVFVLVTFVSARVVSNTGNATPFNISWASAPYGKYTGALYHMFAKPLPVFLPAVGESRPAKVQVTDALLDEAHNQIGFIVKDPKPGHKDDSLGHNRDHMYELPPDATCIFEGSQTSTQLKLAFTDLRYYPGGDVWTCTLPPDLADASMYTFTVDLGKKGAFVLKNADYDTSVDTLQAFDNSEFKAPREQTRSTPYVVHRTPNPERKPEDTSVKPPLLNSAMCIKPFYNTHNGMHRIPVWIEYYLALGVDHFFFYKQPKGAEPATDQGLLALLPYVHRGVVTVIDLHDEHDESGIASAGVWYASGKFNAEAIVGTHCVWNTRGKFKWAFVHVDIDEYFTSVPFKRESLMQVLHNGYTSEDTPALSISTPHLTAEEPNPPLTPLDVKEIRAGYDPSAGKCVYRPELVNVAWIHATANTAIDNNIKAPNGKDYHEKDVQYYDHATFHYYLHFSHSHWEEYRKKKPDEHRDFSYPDEFRKEVLANLRSTMLSSVVDLAHHQHHRVHKTQMKSF
eukprot:m.155845 g.155845  ORF g.155845 m.155845 type:complete len:552 (-) comp30956_c0_seq2:302-1957(-)